MKKFIFILIFILPITLYAQSGYYISKDRRVDRTKDDIIRFLVEKKELSGATSLSSYYPKVYINKELEFTNNCNNALIVKFGSLGDHAQEYWGVISSIKNKESIYIIKNNESAESLSSQLLNCDTARSKVILYYIKCVKKESPWIDLSTE